MKYKKSWITIRISLASPEATGLRGEKNHIHDAPVDHDVRVSSNGRREVRVEINAKRVVAALVNRLVVGAEVHGVLHRLCAEAHQNLETTHIFVYSIFINWVLWRWQKVQFVMGLKSIKIETRSDGYQRKWVKILSYLKLALGKSLSRWFWESVQLPAHLSDAMSVR